ncbi:lipopolysaccharide-binding protein [Carassius auratus]|uniref:Bactericidal permeability-increasing protein n=1 Tax=Carassius auratus TaxID=7957 RepID=A0A6P6KSQ9_CARAU|nr:lipopolysaccharide-binding protein-like [Carassius auratus]
MQLVIFFLMILTNTYADYPALKAVLSEKGLRDVSQMMAVWIQNKLKTIEIPEIRGGVDIGIGTVHYVISNMQVVQCRMSGPSMEFEQGTGVSVEVNQLSLAVTGSWSTRFGIIHDGGSFDLVVYNIRIQTLLGLGDEAGRLSITTISCSDNVGGVDIQFHGGASFFFQPFVSSFKGHISEMIHERICPAIQQAISELEDNLQEVTVNITVDKYIYLSILLTSSPAVTDQSFELDIKGEFYSISHPSEPPFSASAFFVQYAENYMLSLAASEFLVNSAAYAFLSSEVLQINITDNMIPKSFPIHLNTSQFGAFIPQLRTLYPNMEMQVLLYASKTPLFSFSSGMIDLHVSAAAKFSAVQPDGMLVPLFRLDVDGSFSGSALIDNKHLTGDFKMKNLTLTVGSSEIGDFKTAVIEQMLVIAVNSFAIPKLNDYLKTGFRLPTLQHFSLVNSKLLIKNGFVVIFTDVEDSWTV